MVQEVVRGVRHGQHALDLLHQRGVTAARGLEPCAPARDGLLQCRFENLADTTKLVGGQGGQ
jgi:hypothetical protein